MLVTVQDTYRHGKIELAEIPDGIEQAEVIVTFLKPQKKTGKSKMITFTFSRFHVFAFSRSSSVSPCLCGYIDLTLNTSLIHTLSTTSTPLASTSASPRPPIDPR